MSLTVLEVERLVQAAKRASARAYAPYSSFPVGAAILTESGRIFEGCNVENASYGLTICAERSAVFQAVAHGDRRIKGVAVYTPTNNGRPTPPCGACRQVLFEFGPDAVVIALTEGPERIETTVDQLLPFAFGPSNLG